MKYLITADTISGIGVKPLVNGMEVDASKFNEKQLATFLKAGAIAEIKEPEAIKVEKVSKKTEPKVDTPNE